MENFFKVQSDLFKALEKCKFALNEYTEGKRQDLEKWNNWHDLHDRIENRIKDLQSLYFRWHFDEYGWNAYNL